MSDAVAVVSTLREVLDRTPLPGDALVVVTEGGQTAAPAEQDGVWLPVHADAGWVWIGPVVRPGVPGCPSCLRRRRARNRADAAARQVLIERYGPDLGAGLVLPELVAGLVATLVREELAAGFPHTAGGVLRVSARTAAIASHRLVPDSRCPDCARPRDDGPRRLPIARAPKADRAGFRTRLLPAELEELYVDAETGLIGSVGTNGDVGLPKAVARLAPGHKGEESRHGYGRARDFVAARQVAVAEALERYTGAHPRGRRVVRAAYADIAEYALDPRTVGLYPDDWYDQPGFGLRRFSPEERARWVWGYSFGTDRPILVPLTFAYFAAATPVEPGWAQETSNGVAVGGCLTEAIFYGLLEIAERDAFLMTWYGRLPVPRIDLGSAADPAIRLAVEQARLDHGYELMAFATPMEQRVPAVWAMALDRRAARDRPHAVCAGGAHPDPEQALRSALWELLPSVDARGDRYDAQASAAMVTDPDRVQDMDGHRQLYGHPDAFDRLSFLPVNGPGRPLGELQPSWPAHDDLADDLAELVGRFLATGLDVIAVQITAPELRAGGFAAAKVIVPGTLPITFGHRYRRVHGLARPLRVPRLLGHRDKDLRPDDLNPHPHPFL